MRDKLNERFSKIRMIALDLDGTLLNDKMEISEASVEAVKEAAKAGISVIIASGRSMKVARKYIDRLGLTGPQVLVNGGEIWRDPATREHQFLMDTSDIVRLHQLAETYGIWFWAYSPDGVFNRDNPPVNFLKHQWLKYGYYSEDTEVLSLIRKQVESWNRFEVSNSSHDNIEVNPPGVNKAAAIAQVCEWLKIGMDEVAAVGDSMNDLAMLRAVGLGIAMGNAQEELKAEAKWVTRSNDEDGVAYAIRRMLEAKAAV